MIPTKPILHSVSLLGAIIKSLMYLSPFLHSFHQYPRFPQLQQAVLHHSFTFLFSLHPWLYPITVTTALTLQAVQSTLFSCRKRVYPIMKGSPSSRHLSNLTRAAHTWASPLLSQSPGSIYLTPIHVPRSLCNLLPIVLNPLPTRTCQISRRFYRNLLHRPKISIISPRLYNPTSALSLLVLRTHICASVQMLRF